MGRVATVVFRAREVVELDGHVVRYPAQPLDGTAGEGGDMRKPVSNEDLGPLIVRVRGHRVILDADLARLYGVSTKALNQAVRRNADRFPADFAFQVSLEEFANLR